MSIRNFVSGSSVILAGWLGATFLNEVPAQRYPKLDKTPANTVFAGAHEKALAAAEVESAVSPDSLSH
ncbi:MAG: hypothetical protein ABI600_08505 [Luteolibacter sp.]